jgi:hypothetical protein
MKKIKNSEENKLFLHCFLLFYTVFKTMKKIIISSPFFVCGATAFGETGKSADLQVGGSGGCSPSIADKRQPN